MNSNVCTVNQNNYNQAMEYVRLTFERDGATKEELEANGLTSNYVENGYGIYPINSNGVPFTVSYFASIGDAVADLAEDMAAEEKARATYEHLIDIAEDSELINILLFLRQREVVHYNLFKALFDEYQEKYR